MKKNFKLQMIAALFAALTCVATMSVRIPTPATGGYIHPGDALVILCGVYLGPLFGFLAAGIGSAFADLLGGYFIYIPITFVIKGLVALCSGLVYHAFSKGKWSRQMTCVLIGGLIDTVLVAGGYLICESILYEVSGSLASIIPNIIQGISGLVIASVLFAALSKVPELKRLAQHKEA